MWYFIWKWIINPLSETSAVYEIKTYYFDVIWKALKTIWTK